MSSLRNAVKRITHKERSQPQARAHLGILEKKGDFIKRAQNYHAKTKQMTILRSKASQKNPDEFYFGMQSNGMKDGKHTKTIEARNKELEHLIGGDAVRIMKDQDLSYIRMQIQKDQSQVKKLEARLHMLGGDQNQDFDFDLELNSEKTADTKEGKRKHTIFVKDSKQVQDFDVATHFDTVPELVHREFNRPKISTLLQNAQSRQGSKELMTNSMTKKQLKKHRKEQKRSAKIIARERNLAYKELEGRKKRIEALGLAESHLMTDKLVQSKGRKRKIKEAEDGKPAVYKWRRKRAK